MNKWDKKNKVLAVCLVLAVSATGCDIISSMKESFSKDDKKSAAQKAPSQKDVSTPKSNKKAPMPKNVLAKVGDWYVTQDDFKDRLNALKEVVPEYNVDDVEAKKLVLEELVRQQLLVNAAEKSGIASQKDITAAVEEFRRTLIVREVARTVTENVEVSDAEVREFYEEKKDILIQPVQWRVSELVVSDQVKATDVLSQILKGLSFEDAAQQHSISESASNGGDLGYINDVAFPEMGSALLTLEEGGVSSVVKGPDGYYIFKLTEKKGGEQIPFDEIEQDIIQNRTLFKQQQAILDYIEDLRKKTKVEINEELL